jgi:predicted NAD/FAD-binding protein
MRVAIVGGGAAGLASAWLLENDHEVTLYEKEDRLGGHAHTLNLEVAGKIVAIDAGFEFFSDAMFPVFNRLLKLINAPLRPFSMLATQFDTRTGDIHMLPPMHGSRIYWDMLTPRKLLDLLCFGLTLNAVRGVMKRRDTSVTVAQFLNRLALPAEFKSQFLLPYFQAQWGVSRDEILTFMIYDVARYSYLGFQQGLSPNAWKEVEGGTQTYINLLRDSLRKTRIQTGACIRSVCRENGVYLVETEHGQTESYDRVIMATNAQQAAAALATLGEAQEVCRLLKQITYFDTTIAIHGDTRLMPPQRKHWSTANIRFDGTYSQLTVWKSWKSEAPVFRSWVTHDARLPDPLYALVQYTHPKVDAAYFGAQTALQLHQGKNNLWSTGVYMHDVDCHESAVMSAVKVAQALAPNSTRLKQLL